MSLLANISYSLYNPSATIDPATTALLRIDFLAAPLGENPEETLWIFLKQIMTGSQPG